MRKKTSYKYIYLKKKTYDVFILAHKSVPENIMAYFHNLIMRISRVNQESDILLLPHLHSNAGQGGAGVGLVHL